MLATLIVGSALVAAMMSLSSAAQSQAALASGPTTALTLANEIHTLALSLPKTAGDGTPAHSGSEVAVLDDLDGASFSPPIDASKGALTASTGWTQSVTIDSIDLTGAAQTADDDDDDEGHGHGHGHGHDDDEDEDESDSADTLLKLTVTVRQGSAAAGTYTWWINP
jgi:hypothetical protein